MLVQITSMALSVLAVYFALGVVFAILFVSRGVQRIDPSAEGAPLGFRLIIFPGVAALWPLLLVKWLHAKKI